MNLYRVIKPDAVVFSDSVYTLDLNMPQPVKDSDYTTSSEGNAKGRSSEEMKHPYNTSSELDETSGNLSNDSAVTNSEPQANDKAVDEEAVWKRLEEMLEQERQLIISQARNEAAELRMQAYKEGLKQATIEKTAEFKELICRVEDAIAEMGNVVKAKLAEYEQMLISISVEIASKALFQKIDEDDSILTELVRSTVNEARSSEWISVTLSDKLKASLQELEGSIRPAIMDGKFEIVQKDVPLDTCIVETPDGVVDASIHTQINNLKNMLEHIQSD
ncbi:MAG: FliH/SctL family protein [Eubacteriales bacterium]|jgi:flagellar assembly protein FliH